MQPFNAPEDVYCRCDECGGSEPGGTCEGPEKHCGMCMDEGGGHEPLDAMGRPTLSEIHECDCEACEEKGCGYYPQCTIEDDQAPEGCRECPECMTRTFEGTWVHRCTCARCNGTCVGRDGKACRTCVYGNGTHVDWCDGPCG